LRPGEKLFEELITEGEGIQETEHEEIMVLKAQSSKVKGESGAGRAQGAEGPSEIEKNRAFHGVNRAQAGDNELTLKKMRKHIKRLVNLAEACDGDGIREELKRIVPEYQAQGAEGIAHGVGSHE